MTFLARVILFEGDYLERNNEFVLSKNFFCSFDSPVFSGFSDQPWWLQGNDVLRIQINLNAGSGSRFAFENTALTVDYSLA